MLYSVFLHCIGSEPSLRADITQGQIKRLQKDSSIEHEFSIFLVPRRTLVCNRILEDGGVLGDVSVEEFPLFFVPLEQDVLSLELEDSFGDLYLVCSSCLSFDQYCANMYREKILHAHSLRPEHSCSCSKNMASFRAS